MIRTVVFDLFHTLVDPEEHRPAGFHRARTVADLLGLPTEPFVRWWDDMEELRTRGATPPNPELFARALADRGREADPAVIAEADRLYGGYVDAAVRTPRSAILALVGELAARGSRLGLLSNAERRDTFAWVGSPLAPRFEAVVFSSHLGAVKPEPAAYEAVLAALHAPAAGCAYVGDGGSDELTGARRAGFGRVVAVRWFVPANGLRTEDEQRHAERDADAVAHEVGDLLDLL